MYNWGLMLKQEHYEARAETPHG
ncbi:MAG: hypothetical protein EBQ95_00535 [Gammaproteobacteria bacterium]|nr:hypothetical protein [Gammaproteobacteria bacterium]